jgi:hypothetical protein
VVTLAIALMLCGTQSPSVNTAVLPGRLAMTVHAAPALPDSTATEPAPAPASEPVPEPEPAPEPTPEPTPEPAVTASARVDPIDMPGDEGNGNGNKRKLSPESPVETAKDGMWAMEFVFGGLGPLSIAGTDSHGVNRLLFSEIGFRRQFKRVAIPFSVGAGVFHHNPEGSAGTQNDAGLSATVGIRVGFRPWRRIAPYWGGTFNLAYLDPTGDNNWLVRLGLGPLIGIEYYIAHRVSLLLQAQATVGINIFDGLTQVAASTAISAGGQLGLLFYF